MARRLTSLQVQALERVGELSATIYGDTPMLDDIDKQAMTIHLERAASYATLGYTVAATRQIAQAEAILEEAI
jgi:hypothetical protein